MRQAREGAYRLLYLSPERLARGDTIGWLQQVPISFFAIDEAHCISEWGHEFRPEYRQLSRLRGSFPDRPIAAFTASATRHVRHDILAQLELRNPDKYIASFHRPNLRYLVRECDSDGAHCAARHRAAKLQRRKRDRLFAHDQQGGRDRRPSWRTREFRRLRYHAKMDNAGRRRNQERWMSDEVRVLVGTIAFGLGINKATVRAVIHHRAAEVHRAVLPGSGTRRAGRQSGRLRPAVAQEGRRPAWLFCKSDYRFSRTRPRMAAISRDSRLRGIETVPPSTDLHAFWRDAEMGFVRGLRRVRHGAGMDDACRQHSGGAKNRCGCGFPHCANEFSVRR